MHTAAPTRRMLLRGAAAGAIVPAVPRARAQQAVGLRFALEGRFDGPSAFFVTPAAQEYFGGAGLDVRIQAGDGTRKTIEQVARGTHDMGLADLASVMEFHGNHPNAPNKPVAVMVVHGNTSASVLALAGSGILDPSDLNGRTLGASAGDAGRRLFTVFARANRIARVNWVDAASPRREVQLLRREVDAIVDGGFDSLLALQARGATRPAVVTFPWARHGVKFYGQVIVAAADYLRKHPESVQSFLRGFCRGVREVLLAPRAALRHVVRHDESIDPRLELQRLALTLEHAVLTADARADGFGDVNGGRLSLMASQVSDASKTLQRVNPFAVWNGSFLPTAAERNIFNTLRR